MTVSTLAMGDGLLLASIAGIYLIRQRPLWLRLLVEMACLALLSVVLQWWNASPLTISKTLITGGSAISLRIFAGCWWLVAARIVASIISAILGHDERSREARLVSDLLGAAIYLIAALCITNFVLELPVKGVLATSGVVAVVIGLALQNTLADVFSGIAVGVEAPFSVGDRISLGDNIEGVVVQINWRSTRVKTDGDDVAIIPNSRVARLEIINRSVPTERRTAQVTVQCCATIAPEVVLELLEHAILLSPRVMASPPATASLIRLGQVRNMFAIDFSVQRSAELGGAKGQLLQAVRRQFDHGGILSQSGSASAGGRVASPATVLRETGLFDTLDQEQIASLAGKLDRRRLKSGTRLFSQGEDDPTLYLIASGVLEISMVEAGHGPIVLGRIGAGEFIGEVCLLTGVPHPATATAMTRCDVLSIGKAALAPLLQSHPEIMPGFERAVADALEQIHRGAAAQVSRHAAGTGPLLDRIYSFFHHGAP
jgi:CRP-like cAMP-binding protein